MTDTAAPETLTPDVLDAVDPAIPVADVRSQTVVAAAEQALSLPESPTRDEFYALAATALMLSMSPAAPLEIQQSPHLAFHMAMLARDLRISPSAALQMIDVIPEGGNRPPQLTVKPRMKGAQVERMGLGEVAQATVPDARVMAVAVAIGPRGADSACRRNGFDRHIPEPQGDYTDAAECGCDYRGRTVFAWLDAQLQGFIDPRCADPASHVNEPLPQRNNNRNNNNGPRTGCLCKHNYKTTPARMLWQRAQGFCADDWFKTASVGLYDADELGYLTDEDGNVLDPSHVALPDGFAPKKVDPPPEADPEQMAWVSALIEVLDEEETDRLKEKWAERQWARLDAQNGKTLPGVAKIVRAMFKEKAALVDEALAGATPAADAEATPDADVEIDPDTGEVMAVSPNPSGTDPLPAPEPEAKPEQSAAEALSNRGKAVGIDEFTTICIDGGSTVSEVMNIVVAALAELKLDYGRTYADIVPFEPEILGDAAGLLQSGSIPTVDLLVASYKAAQQ